jgi:K+ transporter
MRFARFDARAFARIRVRPRHGHGFYRVVASYGFMETPNVPEILELSHAYGLKTERMQTSFYLGREQLLPTGGTKMARWRKKLFVVMTRNAQPATQYFELPPIRVVELGAQIQLSGFPWDFASSVTPASQSATGASTP